MTTPTQPLLHTLLDTWERNNTILLNVLRALPEGALDARALPGSPTIAAQFTHIRDVRLYWVSQAASEFAPDLPELFRQESEHWTAERDRDRVAAFLQDSARAVRDAVRSRVEAGAGMDAAYDHPVLLLQHMLWHEGYHVGQMMLALKATGRPMMEEEAEPAMWSVWRRE